MSSGTRFDAHERNATYRPSAKIAGSKLSPLPCAPALLTDIIRVVPANRSRRKMSWKPLL